MPRGDEEFAEFAEACSPRLLHAAYLLTGNRHTAEDAAQTALVRTYVAWSRVRRADAFAYARQVLVNHVTDRWRLRGREYATDDVPERPERADVAEEVTMRRWLIGVLASLTARERAVLVMRYFFDLPEVSVAHELRISVGTVKSTSSRALAKLRQRAEPPSGTAPGAGPVPILGRDQP